jgi:2-polyprenyl-3-methyl-5-hydroxy-6-metoxy-1,4-benzoquinol methylase
MYSQTEKSDSEQPWQLEMFRRSLKKQLKLKALLAVVELRSDKECLLITCGDNNGALNWHFQAAGGRWTWADVEEQNLSIISELVEERVYHLDPNRFIFANNQFDLIVCIDVLEHLPDDQPFLKEVHRVLHPNGQAVVTVPNGDQNLLANRIKGWVGMTPDIYGHTRAGYTAQELEAALHQAKYIIQNRSGYSRFFTEMIELAINFMYVKVLPDRKNPLESGQIAPRTSRELKNHGFAYRLYSLIFPVLQIISRMDHFLPAATDNAVIIVASKTRD